MIPDAARKILAESLERHMAQMTQKLDTSKVAEQISQFLDNLPTQAIDITEYDPQICVTAGELRAMGYPIPDDVPDCGWVPRHSMRTKAATPEHSQEDIEAGILRMDVVTQFLVPFRWIQLDTTITKK